MQLSSDRDVNDCNHSSISDLRENIVPMTIFMLILLMSTKALVPTLVCCHMANLQPVAKLAVPQMTTPKIATYRDWHPVAIIILFQPVATSGVGGRRFSTSLNNC